MTLTHLDLDRIEGLAKAATPGSLAYAGTINAPTVLAMITRIRELEGALTSVRQRAKNARGAIESNQVIDKDVHGSMNWILETIDVALQRKTS